MSAFAFAGARRNAFKHIVHREFFFVRFTLHLSCPHTELWTDLVFVWLVTRLSWNRWWQCRGPFRRRVFGLLYICGLQVAIEVHMRPAMKQFLWVRVMEPVRSCFGVVRFLGPSSAQDGCNPLLWEHSCGKCCCLTLYRKKKKQHCKEFQRSSSHPVAIFLCHVPCWISLVHIVGCNVVDSPLFVVFLLICYTARNSFGGDSMCMSLRVGPGCVCVRGAGVLRFPFFFCCNVI